MTELMNNTLMERPASTVEPGSLIDRLRKERQKALSNKTLVLPIPDDTMLYIRYRPVPWDAMSKIANSDLSTADGQLNANIDLLIAACDAVLVKDDDGKLESLAGVLRGNGENVHGEVRFDEYLKDALGLDATTARGQVLAVFANAVSPELALGSHAAKVTEWMTGAQQEVDETLVGG